MMRVSLAWSDVKMSYAEHQRKRSKRSTSEKSSFDQMMTYYYVHQTTADGDSESEAESDNETVSTCTRDSESESCDEDV